MNRAIFLGAVLASSTMFAARADITTPITVPNFSFETYANAGNNYANQTPPNNPGATGILFANWETTSANYHISQNPVSNLGATPGTTEGSYYADEYIDFGNTVSAVTENPVATIDNNATYFLTVALGVETGKTSAGMTIELLSGTNILASTPVSGTTINALAGTFSDYSTSFSTLLGNDSAYLGQPLSIEILITPTAGGQDAEYDNVRLTETTVPEPGTWAMMFLGAGALVLMARRKLNA